LCLLALAAALPGCDRESAPAETLLQGSTMGTSYSVKVVDLPAGLSAKSLQAAIDQILEAVNDSMSTYREDSELSRFNGNPGGDWVPTSPELLGVLEAAQETSRLSDGAFDVTVGPLVNLWGFGPGAARDRIPDDSEIQSAKARVGYRQLHLRSDPPAIKKDLPGLYLDLSAIAKGYGVDAVAAHLESLGLQNYLVEIGGEVWGKGSNARGTPWRIAIEKPSPGERAVYAVVQLDKVGIATSGDYRNYFELQGQRFSHTIDPATGRPVTHALASVTVLGKSVMQADALATALLVLGPERGYRLAEQHDLAALFIMNKDNGFNERATPQFDRYRVPSS
jgi:thiamine biosynthesis lipoprotein